MEIRLIALLLLCCSIASAQVVPYPPASLASPGPIGGTTPASVSATVLPVYAGVYNTSAAAYAQITPLQFGTHASPNTTNSLQLAVGNRSATSSNTELCGTPDGSFTTNFYTETLTVDADNDLIFCNGATNAPLFAIQLPNTAVNWYGGMVIQTGSGFNGPQLIDTPVGSTGCNAGVAGFVAPVSIAACGSLDGDNQGTEPLVITWGGGVVAEGFFGSNAVWLAAGNTTPVKALNIASTGTSQVSVTLGDTHASSTTLITAPAGGISLGNVSTGTNADFLCLSSGGVVLLQSSSCTISSRRFKTAVQPLATDALGEIASLPVETFRLKAKNVDPNGQSDQIGLIAEDIARVEPRCAIYENDMKTPKSYRQECVIALLVKAIQEQQKEIEQFKRRIH